MVEVNELLEVDGETGKVCYKTKIDNKDYIIMGFARESNNEFEKGNIEFKFYEVKMDGEKILTRLIDDDENILKQISVEFVSQTIEETGLVEDFLRVFDN